MHEQQRFRTDIHGLRGVAVALVVAEHVFAWPVGGFIGVDVFFVISGYVITGSLLRHHRAARRIDLRGFFMRRARRLMPAAALVVVTSVALAHLFFPSGRAAQVMADAVWTVVLAANWHFAAQQVDYFASDGPPSPLLHLWSLAVEEQFYVLFPVIVMAALLVGRRSDRPERFPLAAVAMIVTVSLVWSIVDSATHPTGAYFSTFSRAWELGVGALVVMSTHHWERLHVGWARTFGWSGLLLIGVTAGTLDGQTAFPAPWGILPVLGTALVLVSGASAHHDGPAVLRWRPFSALGTISYSLYLWHFPVLVFLTSMSTGPVWPAVPIALGLAFATQRLVERPFQQMDLRAPRKQRTGKTWRDAYRGSGLAALTACATLAGSLGLAAVSASAPMGAVPAASDPGGNTGSADRAETEPLGSDGAGDASNSDVLRARSELLRQSLETADWTGIEPSPDAVTANGYLDDIARGETWRQVLRCSTAWDVSQVDACTFGDAGETVLLVGDSTGAFTAPALQALAEQPGSGVRIINATRFACPWVDGELAFSDDLAGCEAHKQRVLAAIDTLRPDRILVVNIASDTVRDRAGRRLSHRAWATRTAAIAAKTPTVRTSVMLPNPTGPDIRVCATPRSSPSACVTTTAVNRSRASALRTAFSTDNVVDTSSVWCVAGRCPAVVGSDLVRFDASHINPAAAIKAAAALRETLGAVDLFDPVGAAEPDESDDVHERDDPGEASEVGQ